MSRARLAVLLIAGAAAVLLLGAGLIGWQALQVNSALRAAVVDADTFRSALEAGDEQEVDDALNDLQESAGEAEARTSGVRWSILAHLPAIGDDARGVRAASTAVSDLSEALAPVAQRATDLDALLPEGGRIALEAVADLQQPVDQAAQALAAADTRLQAEDSSGYVDQFRGRYDELAGLVGDAADAMDAASVAVDLMPLALGSEDPQRYLLVFQNNAEIRATGGLPSALSLLDAEDGRISLGRQVAASSFGERSTPLPITKDEEEVFTDYLGRYMLDANFTPAFPRTAELMKQRWEEVHPERLDGVISLDAVAISYLLEATGPLSVDGYELTAGTAVDVLINQIYIDRPDPQAQDAFFRQVVSTMFGRILQGDLGRPRELLAALVRGGDEHRIYTHFFDESAQDLIEGRTIAGEPAGPGGGVQRFDVTLNSGTASKMSYYLDYDVRASGSMCRDGQETMRLEATLSSTAPLDAATSLPAYLSGGGANGVGPGKQLVEVRLFTPTQGRVTEFAINGKEFDVRKSSLDDRATSTAYIFLEPEQTAEVTWQVTAPSTDGSREVRVTPGIEPRDYSTHVTGAC
ncbi:DUF4012 domain-containing protein [Nocardioides sp. 31GB23]|uniref:DUF4012 domain-containing protein n=1 Tax=Nocardioides sp. 31GB23 TaxID=3156065 RepID=UPI0032AEC3D2